MSIPLNSLKRASAAIPKMRIVETFWGETINAENHRKISLLQLMSVLDEVERDC
jgi:hypothetical protein